jgi:hypothetical protein
VLLRIHGRQGPSRGGDPRAAYEARAPAGARVTGGGVLPPSAQLRSWGTSGKADEDEAAPAYPHAAAEVLAVLRATPAPLH